MKKILLIILLIPFVSFSQKKYDAEMFSYSTRSYISVEIEIENGNNEVEIYSFDTGEYYYADIESSKTLGNGKSEIQIYFYEGIYKGYADIIFFK